MLRINSDEIIQQLEDFGLNEKESKMYLYLLSHGTSKASDISKFMELKRGNTYQTLSSLQEKGFVSASIDAPIEYSAIAPDKALIRVIIDQENKFIHMRKLYKILVGDLLAYYEPHSNETTHQFMVLPDQDAVYKQILRMLQESEGEIIIVTPINDIASMYYTAIPEMIKKVSESKLVVKVITEINSPRDIEYIRRLNVVYARYTVLPTKTRLVCSKKQIVYSNTRDHTGNKNSGFVTNSPYAVENTDYMCNELWKNARDILIEQQEEPTSKLSTVPVITASKNEHLFFLYDDTNDLAKKVVRFLKFGIVFNYLCVIITGKQEEELLLKTMRENNLDPQNMVSTGRLLIMPYEQLTNTKDALSEKSLREAIRELAQKAKQQNMLGLNIVGMLAGKLLSDGYEESSIKLEQSWHRIITDSKMPLRVLCPHSSVKSDKLLELVKCHSHQLTN